MANHHPPIEMLRERQIIGEMLLQIWNNVRENYLPGMSAEDANELMLIGWHIFIAQVTRGRPLMTVSRLSRLIGRSRATIMSRLAQLIELGYVRRAGNVYCMDAGFNIPHLRRAVRKNVTLIRAAATKLSEIDT